MIPMVIQKSQIWKYLNIYLRWWLPKNNIFVNQLENIGGLYVLQKTCILLFIRFQIDSLNLI